MAAITTGKMAARAPSFRKDELERMIPHIFLPRKLPTITSNALVQDEANLLKLMRDMIIRTSLGTKDNKCLHQIKNLFNAWYNLQRHEMLDPKEISKTIASLRAGDSFAFYVRSQNAGLLLSFPEDGKHNPKTAIFSTFPASSRSEDIMSTCGDLVATCPTSSIHIPVSDLLQSETFAYQLSMLNSTQCDIAMPKTKKAGSFHSEIRDVPDPMLISKLMTALLTNDQSEVCPHFPQILKKVRDQVNWEPRSKIPFRRSGLWFAAKAVLQLSLVNGLGHCDGTFLYKLIILRLLVHICKTFSCEDADINMQIIAKIAHRLCKLESYIQNKNVSDLHIRTYHQLQKKVLQRVTTTRCELETRWNKIVEVDSNEAKVGLLCGLDFETDTKHLLSASRHYLQPAKKGTAKQASFRPPPCPPRHRPEAVGPSEFPLTHFHTTGEEDLGIVLCDFEQYVCMHLESYASVHNCQDIRKLLEMYTHKAKIYYANDPVGGSHMVLTTLKIVQVLDKLATTTQPLLKLYKSGVNIDIVKDLLLVKCEDMKLALELESYFTTRNQSDYPSLIEEEQVSNCSFSVVFASNDSEMSRIRMEILIDAETKIAAKKRQVQNGRSHVADLRKQARDISCTYYTNTDRYGFSYQCHSSCCRKCSLESEANNYKLEVYERPLPTATILQNAVVFELRIPQEIACLRDALYYFRTAICATPMHGSSQMVALWKSYNEISRFYQGSQQYINLGSTTYLFKSTNYSTLHPEGHSDDDFIKLNGFNCRFMVGSACLIKPDKATVKNHSTFNVAHTSKYEPLGWTVGNTNHTQNQVLAKQVKCPKDLSLSEFKEFGSLRAGHRLQLRNIYRALQQDTLSFHEESVFSLICQSVWQAGPQAKSALICRESHEDLVDSNFATALLTLLNEVLAQQSKNWTNYYTMLNIVVLSARTFSLAPNEDVKEAALDVLLQCRRVANTWVQKVKDVLNKMKEVSKENIKNLRLILLNINVCSALTFWVDEIDFPHVMKNSEDVKCWLTSIANIKDNIILSTAGIDKLDTIPLRNLIRWVRRTGVRLENHLCHMLKSDGAGFICFAENHLPGSKNGCMDVWVPCSGLHTQVYQSQHVSNEGDTVTLHMDIILGNFLVNGCPVGYLPSAITEHKDFQRVFANTIFEVKPGEAGSLVTDYQNCSYSFLLCEDNNLIVTEIQEDGTKYELVPQHIFKGDIPYLLNKNYSHWWNKVEKTVSFRPKSFLDSGFLDKVSYKLDVNCNLLTEMSTGTLLIDINRKSYLSVCKVMDRLEDRFHVQLQYSPNDKATIVELPRMGLQFEITNDGHLNSREYPGMRVKEQQKFGTLVGLQQGLLLENIDSSFKTNDVLLIPFGKVGIASGSLHQVTQISKLNISNFFAYEVDTRLRELRAGESHTGWLFLALLHAVTASPMADPFTGLTGTESALRLLQSAHCWSCQPMDIAAKQTLNAIATLSPIRTYYPEHLKCMEKVEWSQSLSSLAAHDGFQMIANKLTDDSQRLAFLFKIPGLHQKLDYNNGLVQKSYWRHHRLYTEQAHVSHEFDPQYKGLPPTDAASTFDRNLDDNVMKSVRIIAHLGYTWSVLLPKPSSYGYLEQLLISANASLTGVTGKTFYQMAPTTGLSLDLKESWLDLYNFARSVKAKGYECNWTILLCYLAFMGTSLGHLQILHAIAVHPEHFSQHNPPPYTGYVDVFENEFNSNRIKIFFQNQATTLSNYIQRTNQERRYKEEEYEFERRKRIIQSEHSALITTQVNQLTSLVQVEWPTSSWNSSLCSQSLYSEININAALVEVNSNLTKWYRNRQLKLFLDTTESRVFQYFRLSQAVCTKSLTQTIAEPAKQNLQYKFFELTLCQLLSKNGTVRTKLLDDTDFRAETKTDLMAETIFTTGQAQIWNLQCNSSRQQCRFTSNTEAFPWEDVCFENDSCVIGKAYMSDNKKSWDAYCQQNKTVPNTNVHSPSFLQQLKQACTDYSSCATGMWNKAVKQVLNMNQSFSMKALIAAGLFPRVIPTTMLPLICDNQVNKQLCNLVGATAVVWTLEQQANRCFKFAKAGESMEVALKKELKSMEHENSWSPREKPEWLLLELEMDFKIRPIQVKVANAMLHPEEGKHALMQLNMGEGKTAVIIPLVAASLANGKQLCRITVLKSLFHMNREALMFKLGGLLNRRVYTLPCRRDMIIGCREISTIFKIYEECVAKHGVVLTLPEYRLSFQLKGYEHSRNSNFQDARPHLKVQEWLKNNARDVLDESDAILHVKYQLVYTVGEQIPVGGESLRWTVAQGLLKLVPARLSKIKAIHGDNAAECANAANNPEQFPHCRLLNLNCYKELCEMLVQDILGGKLEVQFPDLTAGDRDIVAQFLTSAIINDEYHHKALEIVHSETCTRNRDVLLILRGLLACGVLSLVLNKRWRVNYGVHPNGNRFMAVPFRAKDVAAERTEFGHPDVAILSTIISYYYSGLSEDQLDQCFELLLREQNPEEEYEQWVSKVRSVHPSIKNLSGVNLADCEQRKQYLQPALLKNMAVIDFWLGKVVFPKEAKQFGWKMLCSPWDLCADDTAQPVTGFSGTNDTKLLLPLNISQKDLPELLGTNGEVLHNLLLPENNCYASFPSGTSNLDILKSLVAENIPLLLDVGALMTEYSNKRLALEWLNLPENTTKTAAIYFDEDDKLVVIDKRGRPSLFELSPYRRRMEECVIYLDDFHTRGTDLKIPQHTKGCVTLGKGVTKDKLVQGCMRMRMLGEGHTVCFWASKEVNGEISHLTGKSEGNIGTKDVLTWAMENSRLVTRDGFLHWVAAGFNYTSKKVAHHLFNSSGNTNVDICKLGERCSDKEVTDLVMMYGTFCQEELFPNIAHSSLQWQLTRLENSKMTTSERNYLVSAKKLFIKVGGEIVQQCQKFVPTYKRLSHLLDEEQERELEHELEEERDAPRPPEAKPAESFLDEKLVKFIRDGMFVTNNNESWLVKLPNALQRTNLQPLIQAEGWGQNMYATKDFVNVVQIQNPNDCVDQFLRPPAWLAALTTKDNVTVFLLLSPFEVNELMPLFRSGRAAAVLHMYAARLRRGQDILLQCPLLNVPSTTTPANYKDFSSLNANLSIFSGNLYFANEEEQDTYIKILGFIPRPRTPKEQAAFDNGWTSSGFVKPEYREHLPNVSSKLQKNPEPLVRGIIAARYDYFPSRCHISRVIVELRKPFSEETPAFTAHDTTDVFDKVLEEALDKSTDDPLDGPSDDLLYGQLDDPSDDPLYDQLDDPSDEPLYDQLDDPSDDLLYDQLDDPSDDPLYDQLDDVLHDQMDDPSDDVLYDQMDDPPYDPLEDQLCVQLEDQLDAYCEQLCDPLEDQLDAYCEQLCDPLDDPFCDYAYDPLDDPLCDHYCDDAYDLSCDPYCDDAYDPLDDML